MLFVGTVSLTVFLYIFIPKGFFPTQDTGIIIAITDTAQDISYDGIVKLQHQVDEMVLKDSAVENIVSSIGAGSGGQTANNGRMYIQLKPFDQRSSNVTQVIARLSAASKSLNGIRLFLQPAQDIRVGARLSRTSCMCTRPAVPTFRFQRSCTRRRSRCSRWRSTIRASSPPSPSPSI